MGKIYFLTQAYNAEKTLARCVDSVLNQTKYGEKIEYWLCDNGSTDRTREMIKEYAKKDSRIRLFFNEENEKWTPQSNVFWDLPKILTEDDCYCFVDSDDEYRLDFLEKMLPFIEENDLDFAIGGNDFIDAVSGKVTNKRVLPQKLILDTPEKYAGYFPVYHQFARTLWGKIFTGKIADKLPTSEYHDDRTDKLLYGGDTFFIFFALRACKRIGIYPETFYKYYVSHKSSSYKWAFGRLESDQILNDDAEDYLKRFGPISRQNREFLGCVYANAVSDSLKVLYSANGMTAEAKLKELRKVVDYHTTSEMLSINSSAVALCKRNIFNSALNFGLKVNEDNDDFKAALALICPNCAPFVAMNELELYAREGALQNALFNDNMTELVNHLLQLIAKGAYSKQFDLFEILRKFSANHGLAEEISDRQFIKKYGDIYFMLWQKQYVQALDRTTEILLKEKSLDETFLQVHLTLAAMFESVDEFILGKVKLASYYCGQKQIEECRAVLDDLADMGVEDNEEIVEIKATLNK